MPIMTCLFEEPHSTGAEICLGGDLLLFVLCFAHRYAMGKARKKSGYPPTK